MPTLSQVLLKRPPHLKDSMKLRYPKFTSPIVPVLGARLPTKAERDRENKCLEQMMNLLDCMKLHNYKDDQCLKERNLFIQCAEHVKKEVKANKRRGELKLGESNKMTTSLKNKLLKKYPQPFQNPFINNDGSGRSK